MKVAKIKKKNEIKTENEFGNYSVKGIIKILLCLILVFAVFYFLTVLILDNKKEKSNDPVAVIDSSKIILSQLLSRPESEYYVIATKASLYESSYIEIYNSYISKYKQNDKSLQFYYVDLDSALNKKYISKNLNIDSDIENLKLNNEVLFKIKDGAIEKYYVGKDKIIDKLSRL